MKELDGKVVLVTGASRGLGYQAALEAARRGAHVIAIARTVGGLEDLDDDIKAVGGSTTLVPLDLKDFDALDRLGASIFERWKRLDGLVANAGILGLLTPMSHLDPKDFENVFAVNVTANYRLIRSLDPLLRQAEAGRAVFVTDAAAHGVKPFWGHYGASKAALETMVRSYAEELSVSRVKANAFDPGRLRTQLRAKAYPGEDPDTLPHPRSAAPALIDMISPSYGVSGQLCRYPAGVTVAL
jgi:NAD(P)-dependent dehydrogenase (short-subunit alcohol dehydrogenase family)